MNLVRFAMRRPISILVAMLAIALASYRALQQMPVDIFPDMGVPVIYVAQPYGGMDPAQMEGFLTYYYEYHFLYITGIEHVESKNIQGMALTKLYFHPGTNMAQAMAETISYVNRARSFMPPGTVPPFVMRFDAGSVPVGFLVFSSRTRQIREIQDLALNRVRPMFGNLPGVSAPPPFGGSQRTIVVRADPERLRAFNMTPDEITKALAAGSSINPSGNLYLPDSMPIVRVNSVAPNLQEFEKIPIRLGTPPVTIHDIGKVEDSADVSTGYALVDGKRTVYIAVTKRPDASTLAVVDQVKTALPKMQAAIPDDIHVSFEFDQSPYVTRAMKGLMLEGLLGAILTSLMVLLFLRDWRSALVVVLNIPLALLVAVFALSLCGQTINIMTLGGLALAVGILVDEATVAIENIHTHMERPGSLVRAILDGSVETAFPRLLAMLCVLSVFIPSFFMIGAAKAMFVPLSLAVSFSMVASYLLSSTFVPVMSAWLLRKSSSESHTAQRTGGFERLREGYSQGLKTLVRIRWVVVAVYLGLTVLAVLAVGTKLSQEIFPTVDTGQFQLRFRAPEGTRIERTEAISTRVLDAIKEEVGADTVDKTVGFVGIPTPNYPINSIFIWMGGPHEGVLRVNLKRESGIKVDELKERLRERLTAALPGVKFSFESGDIISDVMSFGSPTPIEVAVSGPAFAENEAFAAKLKEQMAKISSLRDLQYGQPLGYPTVDVTIDRERAGYFGLTASEVSRSLVAATSSSRYVVPIFWADPKTGLGYQVQIELLQASMDSMEALKAVPVKTSQEGQVLVRDVATVSAGSMPGEYDRYNMRRIVTLTANVAGRNLGGAEQDIAEAIRALGDPPKSVSIEVRGQLAPLKQMKTSLATGLVMSVIVVLLLLAAYFQSFRLAVVIVTAVPAVLAGAVITLFATGSTLNVQSFMGAIMATGVGVANAILLVTFAERSRVGGATPDAAAIEGARSRLRPILMTSTAMIAGMLPMALGLGESGEQMAPLGRAALGGLVGATIATLLILPSFFACFLGARAQSASLDPDDPDSIHYQGKGLGPTQSTEQPAQ
ncbi:MAG: efflux RND transporter permease subunit [Planctomycetes bacterium]|nr:efflux RND transporter permease subunit [Planctomycetota bacterium]